MPPDERILKAPKGAYWFELQREEEDGWQPVEHEGETYLRLDGAPTPEQLALADATERDEECTYRLEWRPKRKNGRMLGSSVAFKMQPPPTGAAAADDEDEEIEDDEAEGDDDTEPPPPAKPKRRLNGQNGHARNGNGGAHLGHIVGAPRPPAAYATHDPHMFSFQAFDYLTHALESRETRAQQERDMRERERQQFQMEMFAYLRGEAQRTNQFITSESERRAVEMKAAFEAIMQAQQRAAEAETAAAVAATAPQSGVEVDALVDQLAQIRSKLEEHKGEIVDENGEQVDLTPYIKAAGGFFRYLSETPWAREKWPDLARVFTQ